LWLNLGDAYASSSTYNAPRTLHTEAGWKQAGRSPNFAGIPQGLKPKDLMMIPARVALALQADGWFLRSDIIWHKPNPMPESVTDRPTSAHEHIFLLTKSARYFFDAEAVRETGECDRMRGPALHGDLVSTNGNGGLSRREPTGTRNVRNVWEIATAPFPEAHFATFPPELAARCIRAGTSERGCCAQCGAPWVRTTETEYRHHEKWFGDKQEARHSRGTAGTSYNEPIGTRTTGWRSTCGCPEAPPVPCTVLDPFSGAFTTGLVASRLQRSFVGIELNPAYVEMGRQRLENDAGLFANVEVQQAASPQTPRDVPGDAPLFAEVANQ
jgi:hypothetical protein